MSEVIKNFGWIPPDERTPEQNKHHEKIVKAMPSFKIRGKTDYGDGKTMLTDLWSHPDTKEALGFAYPGVHQLTGSCVGAGGGNMFFSLIAGDCILRGDLEGIVVPFWLLPYGRSRYYSGDRNRGEGSSGSGFAEAAQKDGVLDAAKSGLPQYTKDDGLIWGDDVEYSWSDGDAQQTLDLLDESRKHLVQTVSQCKNSDDVRDSIVNGYPCTCASSWGGRQQCPTQGNPPVLINSRSSTWHHQMSIHNWWDHPDLGEIFWIQNTHGLDAHGRDPAGGPAGGFWVKKGEINWICDADEVFAFSQFEGFPARRIPWNWKKDFFV